MSTHPPSTRSSERELHGPDPVLSVDVVICAYTESRWDDLLAAVKSIAQQTHRVESCLVVIDHNPALYSRALAEIDGARVVENAEAQGLAGARNTGIAGCRSDIIAFLDDDALAAPDWVEQLIRPYQDPAVQGTGGLARPNWVTDKPEWFPTEFYWVIGCSYRGLPEHVAPVRNPIGAAMSFRRAVFQEVGGFDVDMGRFGAVPLGCEETVLGIRVVQRYGTGTILHVPGAVVDHKVGPERTTLRYFLRRCFAEGISKAAVAHRVGTTDGSSAERRYVSSVLPGGIVAGLGRAWSGDVSGLASAAAIAVGLGATVIGYGLGMTGLTERITGWLVTRSND
jgi:GT2 family glycosyltransferase